MLHQLKKGWWSRIDRLTDKFNPTPRADSQSKRRRAHDLLERFNLIRYENVNPYTLSGGEKRRLTVAWVVESCLAAADNDPVSTIRTKVRISSTLSIRSTRFIFSSVIRLTYMRFTTGASTVARRTDKK